MTGQILHCILEQGRQFFLSVLKALPRAQATHSEPLTTCPTGQVKSAGDGHTILKAQTAEFPTSS